MPSKAAPPPRPLSRSGAIAKADAGAEPSGYQYREFPDDAADAPKTEDVRILPPNSKLQHRLREKAGLASTREAEEVDFNAAEQATFGSSSRLVKKIPAEATDAEADVDEFKSAVVSNDKEIISQG